MHRSRRIIVRSDNMMVVEAAAGGVMYKYCCALPILLDSLVKLARVRTVITWLHVPGHAAYPLNELVDALARLVSIKDISNRPEDGVPWSILRSQMDKVPWIWLTAGAHRGARELPNLTPARLDKIAPAEASPLRALRRSLLDRRFETVSIQTRTVHRIPRHRL
eukprot:3263076-Pyramimonas_sp.AAC.1